MTPTRTPFPFGSARRAIRNLPHTEIAIIDNSTRTYWLTRAIETPQHFQRDNFISFVSASAKVRRRAAAAKKELIRDEKGVCERLSPELHELLQNRNSYQSLLMRFTPFLPPEDTFYLRVIRFALVYLQIEISSDILMSRVWMKTGTNWRSKVSNYCFVPIHFLVWFTDKVRRSIRCDHLFAASNHIANNRINQNCIIIPFGRSKIKIPLTIRIDSSLQRLHGNCV